jgi:hypothetical protein
MELQHEAVLTRDAVALDDFRRFLCELRDLVELPAHGGPDPDEGGDRVPDRPRVYLGVIPLDDARLLEPLDPLCDRGRRHVHPPPELGDREAGVALELVQDPQVRLVQDPGFVSVRG